MLSAQVKKSIDECVLCWLATTNKDYQPNVSPKEVFTYWLDQHIIIANIASRKSALNIRENALVCISFIDVLVQKGFKAKGMAVVLDEEKSAYQEMKCVLEKMTNGKYPFREIIAVEIKYVEPIIAPSYRFFPEMKAQEIIDRAKKKYRLN